MSKSVSKIRHIQEMNEKLEEKFLEEQLLNKVAAGVAGKAQEFKTKRENKKGETFQNKSPKLEAGLKKMQVRTKHVIEQIDYLITETDEYLRELVNMADKQPSWKNTIETEKDWYLKRKTYLEDCKKELSKIFDPEVAGFVGYTEPD